MFTKNRKNKNHTIIIGRSGTGKSTIALNMANRNRGTTVVVGNSLDFYPPLDAKIGAKKIPNLLTDSNFIKKSPYTSFTVVPGSKFFIDTYVYPCDCRYYATSFVNAIINGCDYGNLSSDKNAMIVMDSCWTGIVPDNYHYNENPLLRLWQYEHAKCKIVLTNTHRQACGVV